MRTITTLLLIFSAVNAYIPVTRQAALRSPLFRHKASLVSEPDAINNLANDVSSKVQAVLEKADDVVLSRAMRFVNHAPAWVTLTSMIESLGGATSRFGFDIAPSALKLGGPAALGAIPNWVGYVLPIMVVSQAAAIVRSALSENDELSQSDISAMAVSNVCLSRALSNPSPANWAIAAVASGYYARNGHGSEDANIKNLSIQVASSVSTAATVLAASAQLPNLIPVLSGQQELTAMLGLMGMLGLTTQDGNSTVKRTVNAVILGGILVSKVAGGALQLSRANLLSKGIIVTAGTAYAAIIALQRARDKLAN